MLKTMIRDTNDDCEGLNLLWTGNWHVCHSTAETVLRGGVLRSLLGFSGVNLVAGV